MKHLAVLAASLFVLVACDEAPENPGTVQDLTRPAKIAVATSKIVAQEKVFPAVTEAARKSVLAFRVSGQITELPVLAAQVVKKGELIARLDDTPYQNSLTEAKAAYELARTNFERQEKLFKQKHVAKSKLDVARSNFDTARAALKRAQDDIGYTRLTAPYDGIISRVDVDAFQNIQAKEPVVQFQGDQNIDIVFNVPENLFLRINKDNTNGGRIKVRFDSLPERTFDALYREHDTLPDTATRSFKVTATMVRPTDITVMPGMSVSVLVDLSRILKPKIQGVQIPIEALFEADGQTWVWRLNDENIVQRTAVTAGGIVRQYVVITDGLSEGDRVIAAGVSHVRAGQKIRPMKKERGI
ncbi:hypothetical protein BEN30_11350 [Magnetovibrio blakemorei]|uniref:Uncharacterized protein n=2 Tax=Magnetovibrio blakemorei TaxID=28181 RepID=A0A1E5Q778_9PROT|nr:hypothetical protein BEN30_11350 [Magnetovibrio blakemorei]